MARQKSDFLKALGTMLEIWKALVDEVLSLGGNDEHLRRILTSKTLRRSIAQMVVDSIPKVSKTITLMFTRLILGAENIIIGSTTGTRTIAKAKSVFAGYLDSNFKNWGTDVAGEARGEMKVQVREMHRDATFAQMFGEFNKPTGGLLLTQDQIIEFVEKNREHLRKDGYATFFLFKENDEVFVAGVGVYDGGGLGAYVRRFSRVDVWSGSYLRRVVVPQLNLGA